MLRCKDGSIYTGITNNLDKRLGKHLDGSGSRYTRAKGVERILYTEPHADRSSASRREAEIKKWRRKRKISFIAGHTSSKD